MHERVRKCRELLKLSQETVARYVNVSQPTFNRFEIGKIDNPRYLQRLAEFFRTTEVWLRSGYGDPPRYWDEETTFTKNWIPIVPMEHLNELCNLNRCNLTAPDIQYLEFYSVKEEQMYAIDLKHKHNFTKYKDDIYFSERDYLIITLKSDAKIDDFVVARNKKHDEVDLYRYAGSKARPILILPDHFASPSIDFTSDYSICGVVIARITIL